MTVDADPTQANEPGVPDDGGEDSAQQQQPQTPPTAATPPANALAGRQTRFDPVAFTQQAQQLAALKAELGLGKSASVDDIRTALNDLRSQQQGAAYVDPDEIEATDPVAAEHIRALNDALWESQAQIHGELFAEKSRDIYAAARTLTPAQFMAQLGQFVMEVTYDPAEGEGEPATGEAQIPTQTPPPSLGDNAPPVGQPAQGGQPTSVIDFVRGALARR